MMGVEGVGQQRNDNRVCICVGRAVCIDFTKQIMIKVCEKPQCDEVKIELYRVNIACQQKFGDLDKKEMDGGSWKTDWYGYDNGGDDRLVFLSTCSFLS
jgi:hypothetical protein